MIGNHATAGNNGEIDEDRFYGATNSGGISSIHISNASGGIEVDHLQYGLRGDFVPTPAPFPATLALMASGLLAAGAACAARRKR